MRILKTIVLFSLIAGTVFAGTNESKWIETAFSLNYSTVTASPWMRTYIGAISPEISVRFWKTLELSVSGFYVPLIGGAPYLISVSGETRFAPVAGFYEPFVGIGFNFTAMFTQSIPSATLYFSLGALRFNLNSIAKIDLQTGLGNLSLSPYLSVAEFRYGPFVPWGARWLYNTGNQLIQLDFVKIGLRW